MGTASPMRLSTIRPGLTEAQDAPTPQAASRASAPPPKGTHLTEAQQQGGQPQCLHRVTLHVEPTWHASEAKGSERGKLAP